MHLGEHLQATYAIEVNRDMPDKILTTVNTVLGYVYNYTNTC